MPLSLLVERLGAARDAPGELVDRLLEVEVVEQRAEALVEGALAVAAQLVLDVGLEALAARAVVGVREPADEERHVGVEAARDLDLDHELLLRILRSLLAEEARPVLELARRPHRERLLQRDAALLVGRLRDARRAPRLEVDLPVAVHE